LGLRKDWHADVLLTADWHWDNPDCRRDLIRAHLDEARERGAMVTVLGDLFCAMQGKWDKRSNKDKVRTEHQHGNYLDALVETAAEWLKPWRDLPMFVSYGNHETSILKKHETDILQRLAGLVNANGGNMTIGPYRGWLLLKFAQKSKRDTVRVAYHHGYGGGGPVTKGAIQQQRRAIWLPQAHVQVAGHIHERQHTTFVSEFVTDQGRTYHHEQTAIVTPTYKEESLHGEGWHTERGGPPKPLGGWWLTAYLRDSRQMPLVGTEVVPTRGCGTLDA